MNKDCQFIRDIVHIMDSTSPLSRKVEKKTVVLDSSGTSRSAAVEIHPRPANTPVSAPGSSASHAGPSSESESRPMISGRAPRKAIPQPAAAETKAGHTRKGHGLRSRKNHKK